MENRSRYVDRRIIKTCLLTALMLFVGLVQAAIVQVNPGESIQNAIDKAKPEDNIVVAAGTYTENIEVNKKLTLSGINWPVVQAQHSGSAINVSADGCVIKGLNAANSSGWHQAGIRITSDNNAIYNNVVKSNKIGIVLDETSGNMISGNDARNGGIGILLMDSGNNTIEDNEASSLGKADFGMSSGIYLLGSCNYNTVHGNIIDTSGIINYGILITQSEGNNVTDNEITGSGWISGVGIGLLECNGSLIKNNKVVSDGIFGQGIRLMSAHKNTISENDVSCSGPMGQAILILQSSRNRIVDNNARSQAWGLDMEFEGAWGNILSGNHAIRINGDP